MLGESEETNKLNITKNENRIYCQRNNVGINN